MYGSRTVQGSQCTPKYHQSSREISLLPQLRIYKLFLKEISAINNTKSPGTDRKTVIALQAPFTMFRNTFR
jgi:hypothetical protein